MGVYVSATHEMTGMFQLLFKYPRVAFARGQLVLLGACPRWVLALALLAAATGLAYLVVRRLPQAAPKVRRWRAAVIWILQFSLAALLLVLLWQPALEIAQLEPQQNIIAVLVDDSRSMSTRDEGASRIEQAVKVLQSGVLAGLQKQFQVRLYRLDWQATRVASLDGIQASMPETHIGASLKQLAAETSDLPIGAVVLLSDGSDNSGGVDRETIAALRSRRIPVHTVGFGRPAIARDLEIDDAGVPPRALADSRLAATVHFHQHGYAGQKATLRVQDGKNVLGSREITLAADGVIQSEDLVFNAGSAAAKRLRFSADLLPGEEKAQNNAVTRLVSVEAGRRRILYVEGEPRWEYKFIRRAETDDSVIQLVSMLRTTENQIYRQGIDDPKELAQGFPSTARELFAYQGLIVGSVEANYFTPAQRDLMRTVRGPPRRRPAAPGRAFGAGGRRLERFGAGRSAPGAAAGPQGHLPPHSYRGNTNRRRSGERDLPVGGRSGAQPGAVEETSLPAGLPGDGRAQAGCERTGGSERTGDTPRRCSSPRTTVAAALRF